MLGVVDIVVDAEVLLDRKSKDALTQSKSEHPKGRALVGLPKVELGVVDIDVVGTPVKLVVAGDVKGDEVVLDRRWKEALTHNKSEQPKGRVFVGLAEYELGVDDPEAGDIDELVVAGILEATKLDAVAVAVASTLEGDEALLDRILKEALTHSKSEQPYGRVFVGLFEGELGVDDPEIGDTEELARRLKDALTHSKSEQPKGRVLVGLAGGKLGVDDIVEVCNTDVLVPAGKVEEELLSSAVLEEVDVLKDTVQPEPRLRHKFKHKRLVQVVVGAGVGVVVARLDGILDEIEDEDDDAAELMVVSDGVLEAVLPKLRDPHSKSEHPGGNVVDKLDAPVTVSEDWDNDEPEIAVVDESATEVRLPEFDVVRLSTVDGGGPLQPTPVHRLKGVDDEDDASDEVGLGVEGDEQFGPIHRVAQIKPEHDVENDCDDKDRGVVVVLELGLDTADVIELEAVWLAVAGIPELVGDWDVDIPMVIDDDGTNKVDNGVDELGVDVGVAEHEGPKQMLKQTPPEQDDVAVVNALVPAVLSVEEDVADILNGPLFADPDEVDCGIIVVDTDGSEKELGLELDVLVSAKLADVLV
ncbi:MAG: hypothetical protein Q9181_002865 [Wetmoreana brouardii]